MVALSLANGLLPHQNAEVTFLDRNPRAFVFSETGTGKTLTLLAYAVTVLAAGGRVLWLTEAGLVNQLREEARRWLPAGLPQPTPRKNTNVGTAHFAVASHQWAARNPDPLLGAHWDLVVVDEADVVASGALEPKAPTFTIIRACVSRASRSVLATATPVATTHGLDLHALFDAGMASGLLPRARFEELVRYALHDNGYGGTRRVPAALSQEGLAHLQHVAAASAVATRLTDMGRDLPRITRTDIQVSLTAKQKAECDRANREASGLTRHRLATRASISPPNLGEAAVAAVEDRQAKGHDRFIVFAEHFTTLEGVQEQFEHKGIPCWRLTGRTTAQGRAQAIQSHRENGGVLLGTRALETGLNLQHASCLISVVATWSHSREVQREGRIRRLGSRFEAVEHVVITPQAPVEIAKARRLGSKESLLDAVMSAVPPAPDMDAQRISVTP